ncbi:flagellar hook-length control protein FliK [Aestuariibacter halophilus]|uniref:Flagellar hook-length control protein FliK n=1 Tax=Fluctibacter halophilus TaxID=226011 RepID=A0ABS8G2N0_9ALTE|nr:flagellar hook-length control protein FliK [Aestuariibacter halophilus]MCC2614788.1 flagellar hook-length control protein FliK [Aestuariibacter halophilus]
MSDVQLSANQLLGQALKQLSPASNTTLASQAKPILVQHLAGNALQLARPDSKASTKLPVDSQTLRQLPAGAYQVQVVQNALQTQLQFLSNTPTSLQTPLNQSQLESLLRGLQQTVTNPPTLRFPATVQRVEDGQVWVKLAGLQQPLALKLGDTNANTLKPGTQVELTVAPGRQGWQLTLARPNTTPSLASSTVSAAVVATLLPQLSSAQTIQFPLNETLRSTLPSATAVAPPNVKGGPVSPPIVNITPGGAQLQQQGLPEIAKVALDNAQLNQLIKAGLVAQPPQSGIQGTAPLTSQPAPGTTSVVGSQQDLGRLLALLQRQLEPHQVSPSKGLAELVTQLQQSSPQLAPALREAFSNLATQLSASVPRGDTTDAARITQLLGATPLPMASDQLVAAQPRPHLITTLISLLQVAMGARLTSQHPQLASQILASFSGALVDGAKTTGGTAPRRLLADVQMQDQRMGLLHSVMRLLSGHQSNKLYSAEQSMQGQDTLYYVLPSMLGQNGKDTEILIRRQTEDKHDNKQQQTSSTCWHLTMRLDIGEMGAVLSKARWQQETLALDLYASTTAALERVHQYLPLLKQRFAALGIEMETPTCQLGKIPESLRERPFQIFEAKA